MISLEIYEVFYNAKDDLLASYKKKRTPAPSDVGVSRHPFFPSHDEPLRSILCSKCLRT
jgi:hypothetical protein